jgi:hypothetical protein
MQNIQALIITRLFSLLNYKTHHRMHYWALLICLPEQQAFLELPCDREIWAQHFLKFKYKSQPYCSEKRIPDRPVILCKTF